MSGTVEAEVSWANWIFGIDNPKDAVDSLGRDKFAESLSRAFRHLPEDQSVVTAVYGPWGSGKTWILERVVGLLEASDEAAIDVCRFSPWELKSHEQILTDFFATVKSKLPNEKKSKLRYQWVRLEQMCLLGSVGAAGVGEVIKFSQIGASPSVVAVSVGGLLGVVSKIISIKNKITKIDSEVKKTVSELKCDISQELRANLKRPILMVIDDLDRLTHDEIRLVVRLLNTTANLPKLHYLIFGDRAQIASALDAASGGSGDRFLEKIVQNSLQLPEPGENQIRLRLWEGVEKLSERFGYDLAGSGSRFSDFWDDFLRFRLTTLRDVHRLLRMLSFHLGSLILDGELEVDLLDLLGIDFLRLFDLPTYQWLTAGPPTEIWCSMNLVARNKEQPLKAVDLVIERSSLEPAAVLGALVGLFPALKGKVLRHLEAHQMNHVSYRTPGSIVVPLGVRHQDKCDAYFRLDVNAGSLPEAKVKEFQLSLYDELMPARLIGEWRGRGWLRQLFVRLDSDPKIYQDEEKARNLLVALFDCSDDYENENGYFSSELDQAFRLAETVVSNIDSKSVGGVVRDLIANAHHVTMPLFFLEQFRMDSGCEFFKGIKGSGLFSSFDVEEIESLAEALHQDVKRRFWAGNFLSGKFDSLRIYRMANALGSVRVEEILRNDMDQNKGEKTMDLLEAVAHSIIPSIGIDSWRHDPNESKAGESLLEQLVYLASVEFWSSYVIMMERGDLSPFSRLFFPHLKKALEEAVKNNSGGDWD